MRWKIKIPEPKIDDIRHRNVFAFLPTAIGNYKVWLEFYQVTEEYMLIVGPDGEPKPQWKEVSRRTCDYYV